MEKFDELLEKLKGLNIIQTNGDWAENLPEDIWNDYFNEGTFKNIASNLNVNTHRWYETSRSVIKIFDRYLGINFITNMFSESQGYEDCYHTIEFFEMEEVQTITYKAK